MDLLTQGRYGAVNRDTVLILSASMPFLYANNFLWTIHFSKGRLRMIFVIFFFTFLVNISGNLILIPLFGGRGAALAYLVAIFCQFILFGAKTRLAGLAEYAVILLCPAMAFLSGYLGMQAFAATWLKLILSLFIFLSALAVVRLIRRKDLAVLRRITGL
jgi:O-antigen/teichoic acid export membrane protein